MALLIIEKLRYWREGGGIEPPQRQSTAPAIGFEARGAHQSHIPPKKEKIVTKRR